MKWSDWSRVSHLRDERKSLVRTLESLKNDYASDQPGLVSVVGNDFTFTRTQDPDLFASIKAWLLTRLRQVESDITAAGVELNGIPHGLLEEQNRATYYQRPATTESVKSP